MVRGVRGLLVAALLLGACNGGEGGASDTTLPPPVTTTVADYTVPAVIDVAYVEKVMAALDHVYGDAIRILARERQLTQDFLEHLVAIYSETEFDVAQRAWVRDVADGLRDIKAAPGDPVTVVQRLVRAEKSCVVAAVDRHFREVRDRPTVTPQKFIALIPKQSNRDPRLLNQTPWVLSFDGFITDPPGSPPDKPCGV